MRLIDDVINREVLDTNANIIGKVKDVEINPSTRKIESIIILKEGSTGGWSFKSNVTEEKIPFEEVGSVGDKIILKESLNEILNIY